MSSGNWHLVQKACYVLDLNHRTLGLYLGLSRRTIQRHVRSGYLTYGPYLHQLARGVHPHDPELAGKLAASGGTTLEALGLHTAASKEASQPVTTVAARSEHADSLVCAAADALKLHPAAVRPAIAAALARMKDLGLSVEALAPLIAG